VTAGSDGSSDAEQPLGADRPITKGEQDRLGYAPFARAIAKSIVGRAPADSIVLAIHGPWGSGKTSAVNLIVEAIGELQKDTEEQRTTAVVRFNPWWFSEQLNLTRTFFAELSAALEQKMTSRVTEGLRKIGRRVSGTKDLLIPTRADHHALDTLAQSRRPMDMMIQGWSMRRFHASQQ
jgi:predicted KAP-like P-loop ATPase